MIFRNQTAILAGTCKSIQMKWHSPKLLIFFQATTKPGCWTLCQKRSEDMTSQIPLSTQSIPWTKHSPFTGRKRTALTLTHPQTSETSANSSKYFDQKVQAAKGKRSDRPWISTSFNSHISFSRKLQHPSGFRYFLRENGRSSVKGGASSQPTRSGTTI